LHGGRLRVRGRPPASASLWRVAKRQIRTPDELGLPPEQPSDDDTLVRPTRHELDGARFRFFSALSANFAALDRATCA
jgi:hypothetical protein